MNKNTRDIGNDLEMRVSNRLNLKQTIGSGNKLHDADLKDDYLLVECKVKGGATGSSLPASHLKKIRKASRDFHRKWAYIVENKNKDTLVTIEFDFFKELYDIYVYHLLHSQSKDPRD